MESKEMAMGPVPPIGSPQDTVSVEFQPHVHLLLYWQNIMISFKESVKNLRNF